MHGQVDWLIYRPRNIVITRDLPEAASSDVYEVVDELWWNNIGCVFMWPSWCNEVATVMSGNLKRDCLRCRMYAPLGSSSSELFQHLYVYACACYYRYV